MLARSLFTLLLGAAPLMLGCNSTSTAITDSDVLRGRVVLLSEDGERLEHASGTLQVTAGNKHYWRTDLEVLDGTFELPARGEAIEFIELSHGTLDGLSVIWDPQLGERFTAPADGEEFTLVCRPRGALVLDVRDAQTGEPLAGVQVTRRGKLSPHPGPAPALMATGASASLELDPDAVQEAGGRLFVRAPGYAWHPIQLDPHGDRQDVALERGGSLVVRIGDLEQGEDLHLFVSAERNTFRFQEPLRANSLLRLDGLPVGRIEAKVHRGQWNADPAVLRQAAGGIQKDKELTLGLAIDPDAPGLVTVDLKSALTGEPVEDANVAWYSGTEEGVGTSVLPIAKPVADVPGQYRLDAPAGPIGLSVVHPDFDTLIGTHDLLAGPQSLQIALVDPSGVELRLMDGETLVMPGLVSFKLDLTRADGTEAPNFSRGLRSGVIVLGNLEPGSYIAHMPQVPGYEPTEALEFEVVAGERLQLELQVTKAE